MTTQQSELVERLRDKRFDGRWFDRRKAADTIESQASLIREVVGVLDEVLPILEAQADDAVGDYGAFIQEGGGVPPVGISVAMDETYGLFAKVEALILKLKGEQQ